MEVLETADTIVVPDRNESASEVSDDVLSALYGAHERGAASPRSAPVRSPANFRDQFRRLTDVAPQT